MDETRPELYGHRVLALNTAAKFPCRTPAACDPAQSAATWPPSDLTSCDHRYGSLRLLAPRRGRRTVAARPRRAAATSRRVSPPHQREIRCRRPGPGATWHVAASMNKVQLHICVPLQLAAAAVRVCCPHVALRGSKGHTHVMGVNAILPGKSSRGQPRPHTAHQARGQAGCFVLGLQGQLCRLLCVRAGGPQKAGAPSRRAAQQRRACADPERPLARPG